ncbi:MAG: VCBS repeat-containing protein [Planctomycetota bacterium]|nr:VCBS repeat-containing protein [Planctomycetota bacterium]
MRSFPTAPILLVVLLAGSCDKALPPEGPKAESAPAAAGPRSTPQPKMDARRQRELPGKPEWVSAGDLDGDGFDELLATTLSPGTLHVFRGGPDGLDQEPSLTKVGDYPLRPILIPESKGPGQQVVIAERATGSITWLRPLLAPENQVVARVELPAPPRALASGDMGGDGHNELVLALDGRQLAVVSTLGIQQLIPLASALPRCLVLAGDCLFVGSQAERRVDRYLWRDGRLLPEPTSFDLPGIPRDLSVDDVDGDGDLELIVAGGADSLWVFGWQTAGGPSALESDRASSRRLDWKQGSVPIDFCLRQPAQGPSAAPSSPERLVLNYASMTYSRLWGFARAGPLGTHGGYAGQTPTSAAFIHMDADPFLDLVVANRDSHALSLISGKDVHTFQQPQRVPVGGFPNAMAQGDLNGDGRVDLVVVNSKQDSISILLGHENGLVPRGESHVDRGPHAPQILDLDADGYMDCALLTSDATGCRYRRLFGNGTGTLAADPAIEAESVGTGNGDWVLCDVTGDGARELLVLSPERNQLTLFEAPGREPLRYLQTVTIPGGPKAISTLKGEPGQPPILAVAITRGEQKGVLIGSFSRTGPSGPLTWATQHKIPLPIVPIALESADMDLNGLEDLVVLGLTSEGGVEGRLVPVLQYEVEGIRHFRHWMRLPTSTMPRDIDLADLNGDGLPEVLVCAQFAHIVDLWEGGTKGTGTFTLSRRDGIGTGVGAMAAEILDLDGKGGLDLAVADGHADQISLVLNSTEQVP